LLAIYHHETSAIILSLVSVLALFRYNNALENKDKGK
jgi:hypothetical protein